MNEMYHEIEKYEAKLSAELIDMIRKFDIRSLESEEKIPVLVQMDTVAPDAGVDDDKARIMPEILRHAMESEQPGETYLPPELGKVIALEVTINELCRLIADPGVRRVQKNVQVDLLTDNDNSLQTDDPSEGGRNENES